MHFHLQITPQLGLSDSVRGTLMLSNVSERAFVWAATTLWVKAAAVQLIQQGIINWLIRM